MGMESQPSAASPDLIQTDSAVLSGKPFLAGTRLSVEFLQGLTAVGWTPDMVREVYTYLPPGALEAALAYRLPSA